MYILSGNFVTEIGLDSLNILYNYTESTLDATKMRTSTLHTGVFRVVAVADSNAIVGAVEQRGLASSAYHVVQGDRTNTRTKL